jgi:SSS family solute:Na+ symporter
MVQRSAQAGEVKPEQLATLESRLNAAFAGVHDARAVDAARVGIDPASVVLQAAEDIASRGGIGLFVGLLLLGAACAVVISTGMNYLLSPTTNIMRDIYQRFVRPDADQKTMVALQKVFVVVLGLCAFLMIFVPTVLHSQISVLRYSFFAYTMYGVAITPALLAALAWKRATRAGGLASIVSGAVMALIFELLIPNVFPQVLKGGDPWGIPSIYPAAVVSIGALILVSLATPPPDAEQLRPLFGEGRKSP